jgi:hypothetical protein
LIALKRCIEEETPRAHVSIATSPDAFVGEMDLIITTTSSFRRRVLDVSLCKPGAVICDVARPSDVQQSDAALRPDILVIESGEILLPGNPDFGFDIGLPPGTAYACLSEAALLSMEGRFEDFSVGRELEIDKVKQIYRLFNKHGLQLAGMRSFGQYVTEADLDKKRKLASDLRRDPELYRQMQESAAQRLADLDRQAVDSGPPTFAAAARAFRLFSVLVFLDEAAAWMRRHR